MPIARRRGSSCLATLQASARYHFRSPEPSHSFAGCISVLSLLHIVKQRLVLACFAPDGVCTQEVPARNASTEENQRQLCPGRAGGFLIQASRGKVHFSPLLSAARAHLFCPGWSLHTRGSCRKCFSRKIKDNYVPYLPCLPLLCR